MRLRNLLLPAALLSTSLAAQNLAPPSASPSDNLGRLRLTQYLDGIAAAQLAQRRAQVSAITTRSQPGSYGSLALPGRVLHFSTPMHIKCTTLAPCSAACGRLLSEQQVALSISWHP